MTFLRGDAKFSFSLCLKYLKSTKCSRKEGRKDGISAGIGKPRRKCADVGIEKMRKLDWRENAAEEEISFLFWGYE